MTVNIKNIFKQKNEEESIDFENIYKHLLSQRNIGLVILLVSFLTIFIPQTIKKKSQPLFKGEFKILIKDPIGTSGGNLTNKVPLAGLSSFGKSANFPTLITYLKSEVVLDKLAAKYGYTPREFSGLIEIEQGGANNIADGILNIYLTINDYLLGKRILTELSETLINASSKYKQERLLSGLDFINKEKPNFEEKIDFLQKEIGNYEQKYRIIRGNDDLVINIVRKDSFLKDKIKILEKEDSPINKEKLAEFRKRLIEIEDEFKDPAALLTKLNKIQIEIKKYTSAINRFRTLSETYRLEIAQNTIPWRIISPPLMSQSPVKINYLKLFIASFLGSNIITISILFAYIKYRDVFRDEEDIRSFIDLQSLGNLPKLRENQVSEINNIYDLNNFLKDKKSDIFKKSIEDYCIGIKNLNEKNNFKSFFLASPKPDAIKTLVNIISSKILSNTKVKVVLLETNFESPKLGKFLNSKSSNGLLDYLVNEKIKISEIINKSNISDYLDIISAGNDSSSNTMLLGSLRMKELIEHLKNSYQYIIVDGSSINDSPVSAVNGNLSDLTTLLISTKNLKRSDLVKSVEKLSKAGSNIDAILTIN